MSGTFHEASVLLGSYSSVANFLFFNYASLVKAMR